MIYYKHLVNRLQLSNGSIPNELMNTKSSNTIMNTSVCICMDERCGCDIVMYLYTEK